MMHRHFNEHRGVFDAGAVFSRHNAVTLFSFRDNRTLKTYEAFELIVRNIISHKFE